MEEAAGGKTIKIPQLEPSDVRCSLGVIYAPDGKPKGQRKVLIEKASKWALSIRASNLNSAEVWTAYTAVLWPGLTYPLAMSSLSVTDLKLVHQRI